MLFAIATILTIFFLIATFFLTAMSSAFRRMHQEDAIDQLNGLGKLFLYGKFHRFIFPHREYQGLFFTLISAQNISRFGYAVSFFIALTQFHGVPITHMEWWIFAGYFFFFLLASFFVADYFPRTLGTRFPEQTLKICAVFANLFLFIVFPITFILLKISQLFSNVYLDPCYEPMSREEIIEMLQDVDLTPAFDQHDKKLIESVVRFKERIAREVMVPRVEVFSLPAETSIQEAAKLLSQEGYSRIPIYKSTVDNITGVLMYKDLLTQFIDAKEKKNAALLEAPIETIQKPVIHTPETKKLSSLLQEFRKKQLHLAIVVDEYGGTEGIVTIEDILEEIVGEISDEYDQEEEKLFYRQGDGSWIVDARMNILDVEEELNIDIPQEGEYDTIGGYIYHTTGTIPAKGFIIHHEDFDIEVIDSNDRSVEKVKIKAVNQPRE